MRILYFYKFVYFIANKTSNHTDKPKHSTKSAVAEKIFATNNKIYSGQNFA